MKKTMLITLLITAFILLLNWMTDFRFLHLDDLRILVVLILGTAILLMLQKDSGDLPEKFRFHLFLMALLMTVTLMYTTLISYMANIYEGLLLSLRPLLFSMLIYYPGHLILLSIPSPQKEQPWQDDLSRREVEVYDLVKDGLTNKEISDELYIAETTVKKHVQNIMKKAGHNDRSNL